MTAWRDPLLAALDRVDAPVAFFLRDEAVGRDDPRLFALLAATVRAGVPADLAVIPAAAGGCLAGELVAIADDTGLVGLHQHGCTHANHEANGPASEFGAARPTRVQRRDLLDGRARLQGLFGARLERHFTPPWNRCAAETPALLAALGFTAISREAGAPPQRALPELAVHVDWCREQRLAAARGEAVDTAVARALARQAVRGGPVGLRLQHAHLEDAALDRLQAALARWTRHPNARWRRMKDLLATRPAARAAEPLLEETT